MTRTFVPGIFIRLRNLFVAAAIGALLASCGGGGDASRDGINSNANTPPRIISFGDSLSDVGTYETGPVAAVRGGRFTTNRGAIWVENIAAFYGTPLSPYMNGGFGTAPTILGGQGHAQGGARVVNPVGIGCIVIPPATTCDDSGPLTVPVSTQVDNFRASHARGFLPRDIVLVLAGANDIFFQYGVVGAGGSPADAVVAIQAAADALADIIANKILSGGPGGPAQNAKRVVVLNLPDIGETPFGFAQTAAGKALLTTLTNAFNLQLSNAIAAIGAGNNLQFIDLNARFADIIANPATYLVTDTITPACSVTDIINLTGGLVTDGSSLFCSVPDPAATPPWPGTLVVLSADTKNLFADSVHPTTLGHQLISDLVLETISVAYPK